MEKEYLGDGVYVEIDPFGQLCLTTENGIMATNTIYLEPEVAERLSDYWTRAKEERRPNGRGRTESISAG